MSRAGAAQVNPAGHVPTTFFELAKIAASGRLGQNLGIYTAGIYAGYSGCCDRDDCVGDCVVCYRSSC